MWFIGHLAFAYFILLFISFVTKREITPKLLILIFLFSNMIDFLHFNPVRNYVHNLPIAILLPLTVLLFIRRPLKLDNYSCLLAMIAAMTHIIADCTFSSIYVLYPLSKIYIHTYEWGSPVHLISECILAILLLMMLFKSRTCRELSSYAIPETKKLFRNLKDLRTFNFFENFYGGTYSVLLFVFISEIGCYVYLEFHKLVTLVWYAVLLLILMLLFILALTRSYK